jgi:hypothetical protein
LEGVKTKDSLVILPHMALGLVFFFHFQEGKIGYDRPYISDRKLQSVSLSIKVKQILQQKLASEQLYIFSKIRYLLLCLWFSSLTKVYKTNLKKKNTLLIALDNKNSITFLLAYRKWSLKNVIIPNFLVIFGVSWSLILTNKIINLLFF